LNAKALRASLAKRLACSTEGVMTMKQHSWCVVAMLLLTGCGPDPLAGTMFGPRLPYSQRMLSSGTSSKAQEETGEQTLRQLAEQGDASAQHQLGRLYELGRGIPQDYVEAARWYRLAAEQGLAEAQIDLGLMYYDGHGVPQDYAETQKWYGLAAEGGSGLAMFGLGMLYEGGKAVPRDYVQAHKWFSLAVTHGFTVASLDRDGVAALMTPAQIAEAEKLTREWKAE
jgi:TPR repeat protein